MDPKPDPPTRQAGRSTDGHPVDHPWALRGRVRRTRRLRRSKSTERADRRQRASYEADEED